LSLQGKTLILGVTGSIAAYKSLFLVRKFIEAGASVKVLMTSGAEKFVTPLSFSTLSRQSVFTDLWDTDNPEGWSAHVQLGIKADAYIIAPATANTIGSFANGLCNNALQAVYLSARCPVYIAPAMDADMWAHAAVQENISKLKNQGVTILEPGFGALASGLEGSGRMMEPEEIFTRIQDSFSRKPLEGKTALVTAGPTYEAIDPVRFIGNHSSGKMGFELAKALRDVGAKTCLVTGPVALESPNGIEVCRVTSAAEMLQAVQKKSAETDIFILAAAVADYRPEHTASEKIKKSGDTMDLHLVKNPDILKWLGENRLPGQFIAGFALETTNGLENATQKLISKGSDLIVYNNATEEGAGFISDTNKVTLVYPANPPKPLPLQSKKDIAKAIIVEIQGIISAWDSQ
jgi:phosphopantothenoylcysteine decarboxylase/phosphopantothenate--cysteine ligase